MSPRDALNLLDQVAANFSSTREDHVKLQHAVMTLNGLVLQHEKDTGEVAQKVENAAKKMVADRAKNPAKPADPSKKPNGEE